MTSHTLRLYVVSVTLLIFFVLWAVIAAKPWASTSGRAALDPRLVALNRRQHRLELETRVVKREVEQRWLVYRRRLRKREALIRKLERRHAAQVAAARAAANAAVTYPAASSTAAPAQVVASAPQVRVVTLPPATSSGSSHP